ncbi:MAG: hypothetical protein D6693_11030 [Planctomycetota bacterium]|nr:MAG: hypothetical protein D6693_11030 [Planctomycetota bacterium]
MRLGLILTLATCATAAPLGCGRARTVEEVQAEYATKILEGFSVGYSDITAERVDPRTHTLYNLTVQSGDTLIHADSAVLVVDPAKGTIALRLRGVVGADAQTGVVMTLDDLSTKGFKIAGPVRE